MRKTFLVGIFITLLSPSWASACSCACQFDHSVSEYMETHKAFWGLPKQSSLTSEYVVTSEVEVVDGYGQLQAGETITTTSQPDDGVSCGMQLNTGTSQFIVSSTAGDKNIVSSCNCQPPTAYLLKYLVEGKDTYLPNLDKCWKDDNIKSGKKCKVWRDAPDDNIAEHNERRRIHKNSARAAN